MLLVLDCTARGAAEGGCPGLVVPVATLFDDGCSGCCPGCPGGSGASIFKEGPVSSIEGRLTPRYVCNTTSLRNASNETKNLPQDVNLEMQKPGGGWTWRTTALGTMLSKYLRLCAT